MIDPRTTENCEKYRQAKAFIKEYENALHELRQNFDIENSILWIFREEVTHLNAILKLNPKREPTKKMIANRKAMILSILRKKYLQNEK